MSRGLLRSMLARDDGPIVMDGGMGSEIENRGIDVRSAMWGSYCFVDGAGHDINTQIHADYVDAGARILIANAHNTRRSKCAEFLENFDKDKLPANIAMVNTDDRLEVFHRWLHDQAVESVNSAIPPGAEVAVASCLGSIEPLGPYASESRITSDEAYRRLKREYEVRKNSNVDLVIFETLTTRSEIEGVAQLAKEQGIREFAVGLTCGNNGNTLAQVTMSEVVDILGESKPLVYFVQCTQLDFVDSVLDQLVPNLGSEDVAGVYANDGRVWENRQWVGEPTTPQQYAEKATGWKAKGARVIGGCCGIGPDHIRALATSLA